MINFIKLKPTHEKDLRAWISELLIETEVQSRQQAAAEFNSPETAEGDRNTAEQSNKRVKNKGSQTYCWDLRLCDPWHKTSLCEQKSILNTFSDSGDISF